MYIKRILEDKIKKYLKSPEIIAIVGARQVGKTTLLKKIYNSVNEAIFLSFDNIELKILFEEHLKEFIELYVKPYSFIFLDEFQYVKDGGQKLKYIYDSFQDKKVFISGSSVIDITIKVVKFLAGRLFVFELYPFNFSEFLLAKNENLYNFLKEKNANEKISNVILNQLNKYVEEYVIYGGYPRVVLSDSIEEKSEVLKNLVSIYLLRDVKDISGISNENVMFNLLKLLALQTGNLVNFNELATALGISTQKMKKYISILEKIFLIKRINPFYKNKRNEIVKNPKIFFHDLGLRNAILNLFENPENRPDKGNLYENFIFQELFIQYENLKFYRNKNGTEVDFIINDKFPIEVKSLLNKPKIYKSLKAFINKYSPPSAIVFNKNLQDKISINNTAVYFLPYCLVDKTSHFLF